MKEELIKLKTGNESYIALWKITPAKQVADRHVLLTHGTFSNRKVLNGITAFLIEHHFTCWIFEWRNHGASSRLNERFNFETIGKKDFKVVFQYLFDECHIEQVDCITHSGGGICLTIALITEPQYRNNIKSISMFACQAFGAATSRVNYAKIFMGKQLSRWLGTTPATKIGGEENETYYMMKQWFDWNLRREFKGVEGEDYLEKMKTIKVPVLSIYGAGDTFIAPPQGCELFADSFHNELNKRLYCSISNGYAEDYNHSRILHSRNARKEIYPKVLEWINNKV